MFPFVADLHTCYKTRYILDTVHLSTIQNKLCVSPDLKFLATLEWNTVKKLALQHVTLCLLSDLRVLCAFVFRDMPAHWSWYRTPMSQSGLNTQKPSNTAPTFDPFSAAALWQLEPSLKSTLTLCSSDCWRVKRSCWYTGGCPVRNKGRRSRTDGGWDNGANAISGEKNKQKHIMHRIVFYSDMRVNDLF